MPSTFKTPGVYVIEEPKFPPSVAQVETAIPAFIGYTEKADKRVPNDLNMTPTRITSLLDYETYFGGPQAEDNIVVTLREEQDTNGNVLSMNATAAFSASPRSKHNMYYALQLYFGNGGGPCYIISVATYLTLGTAPDATALTNGLRKLATVDEPTLIIFPEGPNMSTPALYYTLQQAALDQCNLLQDRFSIIDLYQNSDTNTNNIDVFRDATLANNLKYGAAYYPNLVTTLTYKINLAAIVVNRSVIVEGANTDSVFDLDEPANKSTAQYTASIEAINKLNVELPPSSAVAGVYATTDANRGVWKAPANVGLNYVVKLASPITDEENGYMNIDPTAGKSVNAIRTFTGKGTLVWGARTLAGNDNEWRYVSVRRFFNMVEESCKKASGQFVFEPNDANTWTKVRAMISNFLTNLWRQGALAGAKPEHAFYVACGIGTTMTAQDILEGRMNVEIGMAAVRPAEFIILKFSHKMQES
ncbi:phage tail sheath subtilisin-like domain-containing protein [Chitinophaga horti]|uniref:Phage tail sheath subtilisin-like domain-containing protein n=1 Tax=Chitinophaga horti TaxID=2920382 RepID=A0ABY6J1G6_9BACT|nr:phage tail sheath C-terminal domain-containing protein [Chitinophaga horti]UYQ93529.1 phage tail sheath subtilisin-like domain-containing protein [Chitinophaga horti]